MKKFFKKIVYFSIPLLFIIGIYVYSFSFGSFDFYYGRVSSPKQNSLIIGNSRAAQGLVPSVFNDELINKKNKMYNFSFAANYSPYGPAYYKSIKNKVDETVKDGVFIISVDPGSISSNTDNPNDESLFIENSSFLANIECVSCNPNFEYIIHRQETFYKKLFLNKIRGEGFLHDDGWLEVNLEMDTSSINKRLKLKLQEEGYSAKYHFSKKRYEYLEKTITFLKSHGKVYIVRLPVHNSILERQFKAFPDFDKKISFLAKKNGVKFKVFNNNQGKYIFTDGSHLYKESSLLISKEIAQWINLDQ